MITELNFLQLGYFINIVYCNISLDVLKDMYDDKTTDIDDIEEELDRFDYYISRLYHFQHQINMYSKDLKECQQ